jgi:hypothetical protein
LGLHQCTLSFYVPLVTASKTPLAPIANPPYIHIC